jgi:hypothetical protein
VDCPYANPSIRLLNWQPKREVELELTAKLKNSKLKSAWEKAKKEVLSRNEPKPKREALRFVEVDLEGEDIAYSVSLMVSLVKEMATLTLKNSVLLDSIATVHVFNDLS